MAENISFLRGGIPFLVPLAILLPCFLFICQCFQGIIRVGTYIKEFIEPKIPSCLRWETAQSIMVEGGRRREVFSATRAAMIAYLSLVVVCFLLSLGGQIQRGFKDLISWAVFGAAVIFSIIVIRRGVAMLSPRSVEWYEKKWKEVRNKFESLTREGVRK